MNTSIFEALTFARLPSLPAFAKRAMGLPHSHWEDFLPRITDETRTELQKLARKARGQDGLPPAIFIHGVMPRSGTNLLSDILALHPKTIQNPARLWEFPILRVADGADALEREFQFLFPPNRDVIQPHTILTLLAQGWMRALRHDAGDAHMILKTPHMQFIGLFEAVFPDEKLFLVIRDGRDVIESSLASFRNNRPLRKGFSALAHEWAMATHAALLTAQRLKGQAMLVRYEDLARTEQTYTQSLLHHAGLDPVPYKWNELPLLPIRGSSELARTGEVNWQPQAKSVDFRPTGRWQAWPESLKRKFRNIAGTALIEAGYERNAQW